MTFCYFDLYLENKMPYEIYMIDFFCSLRPKEEFDMHYNLIESFWLFH